VNVAPASTGSAAVIVRTAGDGADRIRFRADGQIIFGNGTGAPDTNFYRSAADNLKTDDNFTANGTLTAGGDVNVGGNLVFTANSAEKNSDLSGTTTLASSASEAVIATYTIPANDMAVGAVYKLTAIGTVNTVATPPNLTIRGRIGGISGSQFGTTGAIAQTASVTTKVFKAEIYLICLAIGVSGSVFGNLDVYNGASSGVPGTVNPTDFNNTTAVSHGHIMDGGTPSTVNTTTSLDLVLTGQWASSNTAALVIRGYAAERIA
jgi:hypothetical protein